jgi:molybdopterin converting factor small subunit
MSEKGFRLRAFGMLREVADSEGWIEVMVPGDLTVDSISDLTVDSISDLTVAELRVILQRILHERHPGFDAGAILDCAIADENEILAEDARIGLNLCSAGKTLALLPPVCGG